MTISGALLNQTSKQLAAYNRKCIEKVPEVIKSNEIGKRSMIETLLSGFACLVPI